MFSEKKIGDDETKFVGNIIESAEKLKKMQDLNINLK